MAAGNKLTAKQVQFCKWYAATHNATKSAIKAGYSEKTADVIGSRLLGNVKVQKFIMELQQKADSDIPDRNKILRMLTQMAYETEKDSIRLSCLIQLAKLQGFYDEWYMHEGLDT